ncbi:MAG TPA: anti-sigma factor [Candidatus Binatia bacterium]|nr:anti-sigma factor [Candidatus Binatia bacterium]
MSCRDPSVRDALAAEYALGTLRGPARERFARWLAEDPALRERLVFWEQALAPLGRGVAPVTPPDRVWQNVSRTLGFAAPARRRRWPLALAAGIVIALAAGVLVRQQFVFTPSVDVAFESEQHQMLWQVQADVQHGRIAVRALSDVALASDKSMELWLLRGKDQAPVSLGLVPVRSGERREVRMELAEGTAFAVSLEPRGGSPTHLPTGPVLYVRAFDRPA